MAVYDRQIMFVFAIAALSGVVQSRAVNISNTWMLPEEGFPVFYRYFRDRISWYEADAVCQFHHANLVTADSSSQYDAIRAYLKELDINEKVWIGLSKTSGKPSFLWTDFRPLSGEGHWQEALPTGESQSLCAVMDPAADFLWRPLPCGGPEVAAFICELPIPTWALGPKGCLLTELPSLTVLYIPEQSALELTSDCGLDGTKRIACKGNADREEMLRQLTCLISNEDMDEEKSMKTSTSDYYETSTSDENSLISKTPRSWTSNTISVDYGMPTRHRRETEDTLSPVSTKSSFKQESTEDISWHNTHREKTVLTTQHMTALDDHVTPTPATSFGAGKTTIVSTGIETVPTLDSSMSSKNFNDRVTLKNKEEHGHGKSFMNPTTTEKAITTKQHIKYTTITSKVGEVLGEKLNIDTLEGTSSTTTQEGNAEEYPSAINQGQLFSLIENGTMFDIIELNETEQELQTKKIQTSFMPTSLSQTDHASSHTLTTDSSTKTDILAKKYHTKKPIYPTKKYNKEFSSKKGILANDKVTTERPVIKIKSVDQMEIDLTKEFEMMPDIKDTSLKLNRTFRKELPPITDENTGLESRSQFGVPRILNFTITNSLDFEDEDYQQDQPQVTNITESSRVEDEIKSFTVNKTEEQVNDRSELKEKSKLTITAKLENHTVESKMETKLYNNSLEELNATKLLVAETVLVSHKNIDINKNTTQETSTVGLRNPIDPRIYILNHHPDLPKNNESEFVTPVNTQKSTKGPTVAKEKFLPKSLLGENFLSSEPTKQTHVHVGTSEAYTEHPFPSDEPKKINRHRSLHTNKQRKFYPYFFSRMLG